MYFAYIDESGDGGPNGSQTYTLGCVLVDAAVWPAVFDDLIDFRRFLRTKFGVPVRAEIKANHILQNKGAFRALALSEPARFALYRSCMRIQEKLDLDVFAICIRKAPFFVKRPGDDPRDVAWEYLYQRLERMTSKANEEVMVVHDEGDAARVRKLARKARRAGTAGSAFGTGMLKRPAIKLIDDPVPRDSRQSYFLQLADLNAYAAFRNVIPPPTKTSLIVPQTMWDELGNARYAPANSLVGGIQGLVVWPR